MYFRNPNLCDVAIYDMGLTCGDYKKLGFVNMTASTPWCERKFPSDVTLIEIALRLSKYFREIYPYIV